MSIYRLGKYDFYESEYKNEKGVPYFKRIECPNCEKEMIVKQAKTKINTEPLYFCSGCSLCFGVNYEIPRPRGIGKKRK